MRRATLFSVTVLAAGCIFGGGEVDPPNHGTPDATAAVDDVAPDTTASDVGARDDATGGPDATQTDAAQRDMGVRPDMPPVRELSSVCEPGGESDLSRLHRFRVRVTSSGERLAAGVVIPGFGTDLMDTTWTNWTTSSFWVALAFAGSMQLADEVIVPDPTGIAPVPVMGPGQPGAIVTRRNAPSCIYAGWSGGSTGSVSCANAWGAEVANTATAPHYFWFGDDGTINSTPAYDLDPLGQTISVPWCVQNPDDPDTCLPLQYGATDARASRGPRVLLSDSRGRAYLWDAVQNIDASDNLVDCTLPPSAPVPLRLQGEAVRFDEVDIVRMGGIDYLVRQTAAFVALHQLDADLQPMPAQEQKPNTAMRPYFDAASDGARIAAVAAIGGAARVFAFGPGAAEPLDITINDDQDFDVQGIGVAVRENQVGVVATRNGDFIVRANAFTMWP